MYEQKELQEVVQKAMEKLGDKTREAVALFYINGYSYEEMSTYLSVPVNTIKARLNLGRKRLKEELMDIVEETLRAQKPKGTLKERVLAELSLGFPEGWITAAGDEHNEYRTVILSTKTKDVEKTRLIALTMRKEDAQAIFDFYSRKTEDAQSKRKIGDLLQAILEGFGITIERVTLKMEEGMCSAAVLLRKGKTIKEIQTRPSIALLLANRMKVPVWATPELIQQEKVGEEGVPAVFEETLDQMKMELLDTTLENRLIGLAFEHGLHPEAGISKAIWTDTGQMIVEGKVPVLFDLQANQGVLARMKGKVGHYGGQWVTDDDKRYAMTYELLEQGIAIKFSPETEQASSC
jgi:bifunctional DNase/RNase